MRFLTQVNSSASATAPTSSSPENIDSDFVVILAALLCGLICVLGLIAVARCVWIRRISDVLSGLPNKGLKKKILKTLPKLSYSETAGKFTDCAICLTEFIDGDELRVLPQCGHGFHVGCIDTWLASHSSCPSCRQILVINKCEKCNGELAEEITVADGEIVTSRLDCERGNRFLA
ncbi:RING-H2 finger protein ATL8-like [Apium graveolens]|uniref:RING-H2 finger protein ATL8-like n=1 Tax=Apium graveolens TaxID=4045 RepID=UPI003D7916FA